MFKLLPRLIAVVGLSMMFSVSGWGDASNNPIVSLNCSPNPVIEGNSGLTPVTCTVIIFPAPNKDELKLRIKTTNGTATTANFDYQSLSQPFSFIVGNSSSKNFTVNVVGDTSIEVDKTFTVSVVNDGTGSSQSFTLPANNTITIADDDSAGNHNPIANNKTFTTAFNTAIGSNLMTTGGTADSDPDADTLSASKTTDPSHGSVTVNANGTFTYTPTTGYMGSDSFTYTISDGNGGSATATVSVMVGSGGGTPAPTFPDLGQCGLFPSPLSTQHTLNATENGGVIVVSGSSNVNALQLNDNSLECTMVPIGTGNNLCQGNGTECYKCTKLAPPPPLALPAFLLSANAGPISPASGSTLTQKDTGKINVPEVLNFSATEPYADPSKKYMKIGAMTITQNNTTLNFSEGDYWIDLLDFTGKGNNLTINITGKVRLFFNQHLQLDGNSVQINNPGTTSNLLIFAYQDVTFTSLGGGNYDLNAFWYVKGNVQFNMNSGAGHVVGGFNAEGDITVSKNQDFSYPSGDLPSGFGECPGSYTFQTGIFDAVDLCDAHSNACINTKIKTKIVNSSFSLTALSLTTTTPTALQTRSPTVIVDASLAKNNGSSYDIVKPLGNVSFTSSAAAIDIGSIVHDKAAKDLRVLFRYCKDSGSGTGIYSYNASCGQDKIAAYCLSGDNFAIRPDRFEFASIGLMKAGEDYSIITHAKNYTNTDTQDYNQTVSNLTGAPKSWWNRDTNAQITTLNTQGTITINGAWDFSNGAGNVPIRFSDVGKFTLDLNDTNWAVVDVGDTALSNRTIHGEGNVTFIPWDFNISAGTIVNDNGPSPSFTYLSNDLNMSARIPMTVSAQNKQGVVTQNYANNMYERNITIIPHITSTAATARGLASLTLGAVNADGNFATGNTSIAFNDSLVGRFNFSRDPKVAVSPFDVNSSNGIGSDVNVSIVDTDLVYGDKNLTLDGNATFVYGRVVPRDVRVFGSVSFTANAWYEVFNASIINATSLAPSRNESGWYINSLHNDTVHGDANVTSILTSTSTILPISSVSNSTGIESYLFALETPSYNAKAHISTDSWLWYGSNALTYNSTGANCLTHPCFNINIVPPIGATGSAKTSNESAKNDKSLTSGGGTWRSTTDYAPTIR